MQVDHSTFEAALDAEMGDLQASLLAPLKITMDAAVELFVVLPTQSARTFASPTKVHGRRFSRALN